MLKISCGLRISISLVTVMFVTLITPAWAWAEALVDPSGQALAAFHASLKRVVNQQPTLSRIIQFGDSHTACDLWTGELRRRLQHRFGDGGHGFVIPGRPWPQYRHLDVGHTFNDGLWKATRLRPAQNTVAPLGIGGVVLDSKRDAARLRVLTNKGGAIGGSVGLFDLFYHIQPGGGSLRVRVDGRQVVLMSTNMPKARPAFRRFEVDDGWHHLEIDTVGRGQVRLYGVVLERRGPGVVVDSVGLPGIRAENLLMIDRTLLEAHMVRRNPDLIIFAFGAVEANHDGFDPTTYADVLTKVAAHVRRGAQGSSCLFLAPIDRARRIKGGVWESLPILAEIIKAQREAAIRTGCAFWDTQAAMGGAGSILQWHAAKLSLNDRIHLNRRGYAKLARLLEAALLDGFSGV